MMNKIIATFLTLTLINVASALPYQAGHCRQGTLAGLSGVHGDVGGGDITQGNLELSIDGDVLGDNKVTLEANRDYTFKLQGDFGFKGFLVRLEDSTGTESVDGAFEVSPANEGLIKPHPGCSDSVSAVTHPNNGDKSSVEFTFNLSKPVADLRLDVTVVKNKSPDNFFYSLYSLGVTGSDDTTSAPTGEPTSAPTGEPTSTPVASPTGGSECIDSLLPLKVNGKKKRCGWVSKNASVRCKKRNVPSHCPLACDGVQSSCDEFANSDSNKKFYPGKSTNTKTCSWVKRNPALLEKRCNKTGMISTCRDTCSSFA